MRTSKRQWCGRKQARSSQSTLDRMAAQSREFLSATGRKFGVPHPIIGRVEPRNMFLVPNMTRPDRLDGQVGRRVKTAQAKARLMDPVEADRAAASRTEAPFHVAGRPIAGWLDVEPGHRSCWKSDIGRDSPAGLPTAHLAMAMARNRTMPHKQPPACDIQTASSASPHPGVASREAQSALLKPVVPSL